MRSTALLLSILAPALIAQERPDLDAILDGWRSVEWEERDEATSRCLEAWRDLDEADLARIEAVARTEDPEFESRAGEAVTRIRLRRRLGEPLVRLGIDGALADGGGPAIHLALRRAGWAWREKRLGDADLAPLVEAALALGAPEPALEFVRFVDEHRIEPYEALVAALFEHPEAAVRREALAALAHLKADLAAEIFGRPESRSPGRWTAEVARRTTDGDAGVRRAAVAALARIAATDQLPAIVRRLADDEASVREAALEALGRLGDEGQGPGVAALLSDDAAGCRAAAARALGDLGPARWREAIEERLDDDSSIVRRAAVEALASLGDPAAVGAVVGVLEDGEVFVRYAAVRALADLGATDRRTDIADRLTDGSALVRSAAIEALVRLGPGPEAGRLAGCLDDPDPGLRAAAIEALGSLGSEAPLAAIRSRLDDPDPTVRLAAYRVLRAAGEAVDPDRVDPDDPAAGHEARLARVAIRVGLGPAGVEGLAGLLADERSDIRHRAAEGLLFLGAFENIEAAFDPLVDFVPVLLEPTDEDDGAAAEARIDLEFAILTERIGRRHLESIRRLAVHPSKEVRVWVARAIGALQAVDAADAVAPLLADDEVEVRSAAVEWLARLQEPALAGWFAQVLDDPEPEIRAAAIEALAGLRACEHVRGVESRLSDPSEEVRAQALAALGRLEAFGDQDELRRALEHPRPALRAGAVRGLAALDGEAHRAALAALAADPDPAVRRAVVEVLADVGTPAEGPALRDLLFAADADLRVAAIEAAGRMGALELAGDLIELLSDPDRTVRQAAAEALGGMDAVDQVARLRKMLSDERAPTRAAAALALGRLGPTEAADDLIALLDDRQEFVLRAALEALSRIGSESAIGPVRALLDRPGIASDPVVETLLELRAEVEPDRVRALLAGRRYESPGIVARAGRTETIPILAARLGDPESTVWSSAIGPLALLGAVEHRPALERILDRDSNMDRLGAVEALGRLTAPGATEVLEGCLDDPSWMIRTVVIEVFVGLGATAVADRLAGIAGRRVAEQLPAIRALGHLGGPEHGPPLVALLESPRRFDRLAAIEALARLGRRSGGQTGREAVEAIEGRLDDRVAAVRWAAEVGLLRLGALDEASARRLLDEAGATPRLELRRARIWAVVDAIGHDRLADDWQRLRRPLAAGEDIRSFEGVARHLGRAGLELVAEGPSRPRFAGRVPAGHPVMPLALLGRLEGRYWLLGPGRVVRATDREALDSWRSRLE